MGLGVRMRSLLFCLLLGLSGCGQADSQTRLITREAAERMTEEQIAAAPVEALWHIISESDGAAKPIAELNRDVRMSLVILHYGVDMRSPTSPLTEPDAQAAIRSFQTAIGTRTDGTLKTGEYRRLRRYAALERITKLVPGLIFSVNVEDQYASAHGSWVMDDLAFPLNYVDIICFRHTEVCEMTSADFSSPDFSERLTSGPEYQLLMSTARFYIDRWENGVVEAVSARMPTSCRETRLTINALSQRVFQSTQDLNPDGCSILGSERRLPPLTEPRIARLADAYATSQGYFNRIRSRLRTVYGPLAPPEAD